MFNLHVLDAAAAGAGGGMSLILMLLVYGLFFVALYFIFFRPQNIVAVKDESDSVIIETGSDKSKLRVKRWSIGSVDTVHEDDNT